VGPVSDEVKQLLKTTKESLYIGIENAVAGKHIGDIGSAVQDHCEAQGYGIVRELTGHGIGRQMHEDPQVPNYGRRGNGMMLKAGMCIAIEPMITMGDRAIYMDAKDRWTIRTRDGKPAAHFEHTIAVRRGKAEILSSFEEVESIEGILY
jgi:methionyl aminopeptidase